MRNGYYKEQMPEYAIWQAMRQRCFNPAHPSYKNYGGRGITICSRWNSFDLFLQDVGWRPISELTLERKDNDGNYEPSNVFWATRKHQQNNRRANRRITFGARTLTISQWADELGIPANRISGRLRDGMTDEQALFIGRHPARSLHADAEVGTDLTTMRSVN